MAEALKFGVRFEGHLAAAGNALLAELQRAWTLGMQAFLAAVRRVLDWTYQACGAAAALAVLGGIGAALLTRWSTIAAIFMALATLSYQVTLAVLPLLA